jgi:hypothetical protein
MAEQQKDKNINLLLLQEGNWLGSTAIKQSFPCPRHEDIQTEQGHNSTHS